MTTASSPAVQDSTGRTGGHLEAPGGGRVQPKHGGRGHR